MATRSKLTRIEKRKKLEALFDKGAYVWFTGDEGSVIIHTEDEATDEDMAIWVRPCSPLQREMVVRESQAARARAVVAARDERSIEWVTVRGYIAGLSFDALVDYVLELDDSDRLSEARRDVLKEKEWEDFNQLRDAMRQYEDAGSPVDDPEWQPLLDRDTAFGSQVNARADELRESAYEAHKLMPRARLEERAIDKRIDQAGTGQFVDSYEIWTLFYSCRDDEDHLSLFFDDIAEMRSQPEELLQALRDKLASFITEAGEAKNSQGVASGSASSEPPAAPETSESSTPEASSE